MKRKQIGVTFLRNIGTGKKSQLTFACSKSTIETVQKRCKICSKLTLKTPERHPKLFNPMSQYSPFKLQTHKMVKHTQTIRRQIVDELFECV